MKNITSTFDPICEALDIILENDGVMSEWEIKNTYRYILENKYSEYLDLKDKLETAKTTKDPAAIAAAKRELDRVIGPIFGTKRLLYGTSHLGQRASDASLKAIKNNKTKAAALALGTLTVGTAGAALGKYRYKKAKEKIEREMDE